MKYLLRGSLFFLIVLVFPSLPAEAVVYHPLPKVEHPANNPWSIEKFELGQKLFFDPLLSGDNTMSCESCHKSDKGWVDGLPRAEGFQGMELGRNTPTILNTGFMKFQFWDGRASSLEGQATQPIQSPVEMNQNIDELIQELRAQSDYIQLFKKAFESEEITIDKIAKAIAVFERTIVSGTSAYDRYWLGNKEALSPKALRGMSLFFGKAKCSICHTGPFFTDSQFHNIGVPPLKNKDKGRKEVTGEIFHEGAFKTPGLRDVNLTGPYMHNGIFTTLEQVIEFYDQGGVNDSNKSPFITPIGLNTHEKESLLEFLNSLTSDSGDTYQNTAEPSSIDPIEKKVPIPTKRVD